MSRSQRGHHIVEAMSMQVLSVFKQGQEVSSSKDNTVFGRQRHQLVYLKENAPFKLISQHTSHENICAAVKRWISQGFPCIFACQNNAQVTSVKLGLPIRINDDIHRVAIEVETNFISHVSDLPKLESILKSQDACRSQSNFSESIYVYGSFLWQAITKESHVRYDSDLDILIAYQESSLFFTQQKIETLQLQLERVIDGEVRFNKIGDVSLKELIYSDSHELLVKTSNMVYLIQRDKLYEYYPTLLH